jgi:uncharacterized protein
VRCAASTQFAESSVGLWRATVVRRSSPPRPAMGAPAGCPGRRRSEATGASGWSQPWSHFGPIFVFRDTWSCSPRFASVRSAAGSTSGLPPARWTGWLGPARAASWRRPNRCDQTRTAPKWRRCRFSRPPGAHALRRPGRRSPAQAKHSISWTSFGAFLLIPRAFLRPLSPATAADRVTDWLAAPAARHDIRGGLVPEATLTALAIEHGLTLHRTDPNFARFTELRWQNPLRGTTL